MNHVLTFVLAFSLASTGSLNCVSRTASKATKAESLPLIHFEIINMSGQSREAHVGDAIVPLPVAQRVALQVPAGKSVTIMSNTNSRVTRVITISATDEGHLFPVV